MVDRSLVLRWSDANTLTYHEVPSRNSSPTDGSRENPILHRSVLGGIKWNIHTRKLISQSHGYFLELQDEARQEETVPAESLVRYSKLYRAVLHECVMGLREKETRSMYEYHEEEEEGEEVSLYGILELTWHLCEVLFIEVLPAGCLIQQLLEWIRWNNRSEEEELKDLMVTSTPEEDVDLYWNILYRLVLKGLLFEASSLLLHHSQAQTMPRAFSNMKELLCSAPMVTSTAGLSRTAIHLRWSEWRKEVTQRKEGGEFISVPQLQLLAKILCGDEDAFAEREILDCSENWYVLMVGKLLYCNPLVVSSDYELSYCAERSVRAMGVERAPLDNLLLAALRKDFIEVIRISSSEISNWWCVAHLSNLLQHQGLLAQQRLESAPKLCEFLLVEYSMSLLTHPSLWEVSMSYLAHCSTTGRHYMQLLVERIPFTSERDANKILSLCRRYQLKEQSKDICKVLAMRAYRNGRFGTALTWCIRGKNSAFAAVLAEKYMESFESLGEFMDIDLLDHLGDAMLMNDKLLFLGKYREFHQLYKKEEFVSSGALLISLLTSGTVPQRFLPTLLKDALHLLHKDQLVFSSEDTYTLTHLLLQLTVSPIDQIGQDHTAGKMEDELVKKLRLALTMNLTQAIMEEGN